MPRQTLPTPNPLFPSWFEVLCYDTRPPTKKQARQLASLYQITDRKRVNAFHQQFGSDVLVIRRQYSSMITREELKEQLQTLRKMKRAIDTYATLVKDSGWLFVSLQLFSPERRQKLEETMSTWATQEDAEMIPQDRELVRAQHAVKRTVNSLAGATHRALEFLESFRSGKSQLETAIQRLFVEAMAHNVQVTFGLEPTVETPREWATRRLLPQGPFVSLVDAAFKVARPDAPQITPDNIKTHLANWKRKRRRA